MSCLQPLTLLKISDRNCKERSIVNMDEFNINNVIIGKRNKYAVYYIYNGDMDSGSAIIEPLRLYCKNLRVNNNRHYIIPKLNPNSTGTKLRYIKFPINIDTTDIDTTDIDTTDIDTTDIDTTDIDTTDIDTIDIKRTILGQIIQNIKIKLIQTINNDNALDDDLIEKFINNNKFPIYVLVKSTGDLESRVVRLGSMFTNYTNIQITNPLDLQCLVRDPKYNKQSNNSYYICNAVLMFNTFFSSKKCEDDKNKIIESCSEKNELILNSEKFKTYNENTSISFRTCIDVMELYYNKSKYLSNLDPHNKIVVFDNTLVL
jgi:hypothetical protein